MKRKQETDNTEQPTKKQKTLDECRELIKDVNWTASGFWDIKTKERIQALYNNQCFKTWPSDRNFDPQAFIIQAITDRTKEAQFWHWVTQSFTLKQEQSMLLALKNAEMETLVFNQGKIASLISGLLLFTPYNKKLEEGEQYLLKAKDCGEISAIITEGRRLLHNNLGKNKNIQEALKFFNQATEENSYIFYLGLCSKEIKDFKHAVECFEEGAKKNCMLSQFNLGLIYLEGYDGCPRNIERAEEYFYEAAVQGHVDSWFRLAALLNERNFLNYAMLYLQQALVMGMREACYAAGMLAKRIFPKSGEEIKYFKIGAEEGDNLSMYQLGSYYSNMKMYQQADNYYRMAAKAGHVDAFFDLADIHLNKTYKKYDRKNVNLGYLCLNEGIKRGDPHCLRLKGTLFFTGNKDLGIEQDFLKAKLYFECAAERKIRLAYVYLGYMHQRGLGVAADIVKAFNYYRKATNAGLCIRTEVHYLSKKLNEEFNYLDEEIAIEPLILLNFMFSLLKQEILDSPSLAQLNKAGCMDMIRKNLERKPTLNGQQGEAIWNKFCQYQLKQHSKDSEEYLNWSIMPTKNKKALQDIFKLFPHVIPASDQKKLLTLASKTLKKQEDTNFIRKCQTNIEIELEKEYLFQRYKFFSSVMMQAKYKQYNETREAQTMIIPEEIKNQIFGYMIESP